MNKKIYNKKGFWTGIVFLSLAILHIFILMPSYYKSMEVGKMIKSIISIILLLLLGSTSLHRSLDYKKTKEDEKENDEREKLIDLKASSTALKITQYFCCILMILSMFAWYFSKIEGLIGVVTGLGILWTVSIFSEMGAYFYHEKRN